MFNLGNKEAILNSNAKFTASVSGNKLNLKGFGTFDSANLVSAVCQRYKTSRLNTLSFDAPAGSALNLVSGQTNVPVTFSIKIKSTRLSSEWANNFIVNSKPIVFEILVNYADTSAQVAVKMTDAFAQWAAKFTYADNGLPFTYAADASITGYLTLTLKEYFLYFQKSIVFKTDRIATPITVIGEYYNLIDSAVTVTSDVISNSDTSTLRVGDTVAFVAATYVPTHASASMVTSTILTIDSATAFTLASGGGTGAITTDKLYLIQAQEDPTFSGKYLEENARMSLEDTNGAYSISPDERPMISGNYASISFVMKDTNGGVAGASSYAKHAFLGSTRGAVGGERQFKFTLYVLEGSDAWGATGNVDKIVEWLDAGLNSPALLMYLGNSSVVTTADTFRA